MTKVTETHEFPQKFCQTGVNGIPVWPYKLEDIGSEITAYVNNNEPVLQLTAYAANEEYTRYQVTLPGDSPIAKGSVLDGLIEAIVLAAAEHVEPKQYVEDDRTLITSRVCTEFVILINWERHRYAIVSETWHYTSITRDEKAVYGWPEDEQYVKGKFLYKVNVEHETHPTDPHDYEDSESGLAYIFLNDYNHLGGVNSSSDDVPNLVHEIVNDELCSSNDSYPFPYIETAQDYIQLINSGFADTQDLTFLLQMMFEEHFYISRDERGTREKQQAMMDDYMQTHGHFLDDREEEMLEFSNDPSTWFLRNKKTNEHSLRRPLKLFLDLMETVDSGSIDLSFSRVINDFGDDAGEIVHDIMCRMIEPYLAIVVLTKSGYHNWAVENRELGDITSLSADDGSVVGLVYCSVKEYKKWSGFEGTEQQYREAAQGYVLSSALDRCHYWNGEVYWCTCSYTYLSRDMLPDMSDDKFRTIGNTNYQNYIDEDELDWTNNDDGSFVIHGDEWYSDWVRGCLPATHEQLFDLRAFES